VRGEEAFWTEFLNRVRARIDGASVSGECFSRLARHFRDPSSWAVYPDVVETLDRLETSGFALGVVSNWDSHLPRLLEALELARRFSVVAVSAIEETGKPDPEIFRRACTRLGLSAGECVHVGDSLREDYEGARGAGLRALLLDRRGKYPDVSDRIESLAEIPDRLRVGPG
jgi:putative hydrolase of the HAD superfamily